MNKFPKMVYNKSGLHTTVQNQEELDQIKDVFCDPPMGGTKRIFFAQALQMLNEVKESIKEPPKKGYKEMKWGELKSYAKKLGVKSPVRANRETIEQAIQEVLDGNDKRSS